MFTESKGTDEITVSKILSSFSKFFILSSILNCISPTSDKLFC